VVLQRSLLAMAIILSWVRLSSSNDQSGHADRTPAVQSIPLQPLPCLSSRQESCLQTLLTAFDWIKPSVDHAAGFNSNRDAADQAKGELESEYNVKVITVEGDISQTQSVELMFQAVKVTCYSVGTPSLHPSQDLVLSLFHRPMNLHVYRRWECCCE